MCIYEHTGIFLKKYVVFQRLGSYYSSLGVLFSLLHLLCIPSFPALLVYISFMIVLHSCLDCKLPLSDVTVWNSDFSLQRVREQNNSSQSSIIDLDMDMYFGKRQILEILILHNFLYYNMNFNQVSCYCFNLPLFCFFFPVLRVSGHIEPVCLEQFPF